MPAMKDYALEYTLKKKVYVIYGDDPVSLNDQFDAIQAVHPEAEATYFGPSIYTNGNDATGSISIEEELNRR